jgi:CRISPR-associated endonuclease/helicase Cas3
VLNPALCFRVNGVGTLHHGRFAPNDRKLQDAAVEVEFGKGRTAIGRIIVGTQTLEQSLDIDADLLITDLAPIDVLLQRIGRLHRHQRNDRKDFGLARAIILTPAERDLSRLLGKEKDRHGLGPMRDGSGVYPDLHVIEATLRLIEANATLSIPADNRRLVEGALHREVKGAISNELGPAWGKHADMLDGRDMYDKGLARNWSLDIRERFTSLIFPNADEAISTRLGLKNRIVDLPSDLMGPFGTMISRLTIPGWMAVGTSVDASPEIITAAGGIIIFTLDNKQFRYDRFGLTREKT